MQYKITHFPNLTDIADEYILSVSDKILPLLSIEFDNGEKFHFILPSSKINPLFKDEKYHGISFHLNQDFKYFLTSNRIDILENTSFEEDIFWSDNVEQYEEQKEKFLSNNKNISTILENTLSNIKGKPNWVQNDETPQNSNGKNMEFIGQLYIGSYIDDIDTDIFLFYSKTDNIVVQIYQFG